MPKLPACTVCDFANRPETCYAARLGCARMCDLIAMGRLDYRRLIWARTCSDPLPFQSDVAFVPDPLAVVVPINREEAKANVAKTLAIERMVVHCEHRRKEANCGCAGRWRCLLYAKDVSFQECMICQTDIVTRQQSES